MRRWCCIRSTGVNESLKTGLDRAVVRSAADPVLKIHCARPAESTRWWPSATATRRGVLRPHKIKRASGFLETLEAEKQEQAFVI
jgi:hypothetical protein